MGTAHSSKYKSSLNPSETPLLTDPLLTDPLLTDPLLTDPLLTDPLLTDPLRARSSTLAHRDAGYQFTQHDEHRHIPMRHLALLQSCCFSLQEESSLRNQGASRL